MRSFVLALTLLFAATAAHANEMIRAAELKFNDGVKNIRKADLEQVLADDFVYQHGGGRTLDKATFIELATSGGITVTTRGPLGFTFRDYGDTVVSYGESTMAGKVFGQDYDGRLRFVDVWRNNGGRWQMVHRNSELLPHLKK